MYEYAVLAHLLSKVDTRGFKIWLTKMNAFNGRLETFETWKSPFVSAKQLAASGFYYTQVEDYCKCFACGVMIYKWEAGDTADGEHLKYRSHCPYMKCKERAGTGDPDIVYQRDGHMYYDVCGRGGVIDNPGCGLYRRVMLLRNMLTEMLNIVKED